MSSAFTSTIWFISERSITSPPSGGMAKAPTLEPVTRTDTGSSSSPAIRTAAWISSVVLSRTARPGRRGSSSV